MSANKGIRITIDGASGTGKTILMNAFAEFLKQQGIPAENITQLCDSGPAYFLEGQAAFDRLKLLYSRDGLTVKHLVFLERHVPRHTLSENDGDWDAMPDLSKHPIPDSPAFLLPRSQVAFEMTNQPSKADRVRDSLLVMLKFAGVMAAIKNTLPAGVEVPTDLQDWLSRAGVVTDADRDYFNTWTAGTKHAPDADLMAQGAPVSDMPGDGKSLGDMMTRSLSDGHQAFQDRAAMKLGMFEKTRRLYVAPPSTLQVPTLFWETSPAAQLLKADVPGVALREAMVRPGIEYLWHDHRVSIQLIDRERDGDWYDEIRTKHEPDNVYQCWADVCIARKDGESVTEQVRDILKKACREFDPLITVSYKVKNASLSGAHVSVGSTPLFNPAVTPALQKAGQQALRDLTSQLLHESSSVHGGTALGHPHKHPRGMNPYISHIDDAPFFTTQEIAERLSEDMLEDLPEGSRVVRAASGEVLNVLVPTPVDPSLKAQMDEAEKPRIVNAEPTMFCPLYNSDVSTRQEDPVLGVKVHDGKQAGNNLFKVTDITQNGAGFLPPTGD